MLQCPKCKSKDMNFLPWLGMIYECRNCGYRGPIAVTTKKVSKIQ